MRGQAGKTCSPTATRCWRRRTTWSGCSEELTIPGPRMPLTKDASLFRQGAALGAELIWLHTYGERSAGRKAWRNAALQGSARCTRPVGEDR